MSGTPSAEARVTRRSASNRRLPRPGSADRSAELTSREHVLLPVVAVGPGLYPTHSAKR